MKAMFNAIAAVLLTFTLAGCVTLRPPPALGAGDWVLARWQDNDPHSYPAIVTQRVGDELSLQYDDGDVGAQPAHNVRRFDWRAGTRLQCRFLGNNQWYDGTILELAPNRVDLRVRYDDGDEEATNTSRCRDR